MTTPYPNIDIDHDEDPIYWVEPDGHGDPTLWEHYNGDDPQPLIRRSELTGRNPDLVWARITRGLDTPPPLPVAGLDVITAAIALVQARTGSYVAYGNAAQRLNERVATYLRSEAHTERKVTGQ